MSGAPDLSVVVPLFNEEESVGPLVEAVRSALAETPSWELVLVDDGSSDDTPRLAGQIAAADPRVHLVRLARNFGQTPAMQAGFDHVRGRVVVTMDGDLQNDPRDIPALVARLEEGYDLVAGYRVRRQDKLLTRKVPSWIANALIRRLTRVDIRDNGCSLKAYRREVVERMHLYSDMHRFIPAIAAATSGARITEMPVRHHARGFGRSKYGLSRVPRVIGDLLVVTLIRSFRNRPLALFGGAAALAFLVGLVSAVAVLLLDLRPGGSSVVVQGVALLWFELALYLLMLGLLAEVVLREPGRFRPVALAREWAP
ncbi:MAG: glycosyltransferase family 2 protein [Gemmatimonadota bacterium]|jgi:glycosyltransferase involved in cell wall biosynthesis|nr:glycosyltransferase family 2 protein [Gemmatimonadota bacterium]